jgi:hypothetical protein
LPLDFSLDSLLDFALDWVVEGQTGRLDSGLETNLAPLFYKDQSGTNLAPIWRSPPEALQGFLKLNKLRQAMRGCLMHVMFLFLLLNSFEDLSSFGQASYGLSDGDLGPGETAISSSSLSVAGLGASSVAPPSSFSFPSLAFSPGLRSPSRTGY